MADVNVRTAELTVVTVRLTVKLLKQMRTLQWDEVRKLIKDGELPTIGWVHGSVLGDEWSAWLLLDLGKGQWGKYSYSLTDAQKKYTQLYL
jgi:hypothetical protein